MYEKGLERRPRLLALERSEAGLRGQVGRLTGQIAQLEKQIGDAGLRISQIERELQREVSIQLDAVEEQIQTMNEQRPVVSASVERLDIRAPRGGRVIDLQVHTVGQVIAPREHIMQIRSEEHTSELQSLM